MAARPQLKGLFQARLKTASLIGGAVTVVSTIAYYYLVPHRRLTTYEAYEKANTYEKQMQGYERMKAFGVFKKLGPDNAVVTLDEEAVEELKTAGTFK